MINNRALILSSGIMFLLVSVFSALKGMGFLHIQYDLFAGLQTVFMFLGLYAQIAVAYEKEQTEDETPTTRRR